ncbi:hypothetical protein [Jeotgalicoccus halotolerans]|uniref:Uncharacterized protein n=1 Tax=Jeotgalicoccus halotolerans TaxID=157227 RepID=A0A3E0AVL5_9STAP|nr:hypothetical protein [Jeotgalicoccus halotolerans]REG23806.1 hypothetical protein DFR63_1553 [Jeotgalicoccus halotolerans]
MDMETLKKVLPPEKFQSWLYDYQISNIAIAARIGITQTKLRELKNHYRQQGYEFPDKKFH